MDEIYEDEEVYEEKKQRFNLGDKGRKILTYAIIIVVAFAFGCGIVGIPMRASENVPRKELAKTEFYIRTIISGFDVEVFNDTFADYVYEFNSSASTFEDSGGEVTYNDVNENVEFMTIYYPPAVPDTFITKITFRIGEKSQLNIIIFADNREVFNALKIKNDILLDLTIPAIEIVVYIF
ncbi:MAG: hypothetical protein FK730_06405 [Asgard group archaeon]|nr:hypothetical protein [Asgard group archaeon]